MVLRKNVKTEVRGAYVEGMRLTHLHVLLSCFHYRIKANLEITLLRRYVTQTDKFMLLQQVRSVK